MFKWGRIGPGMTLMGLKMVKSVAEKFLPNFEVRGENIIRQNSIIRLDRYVSRKIFYGLSHNPRGSVAICGHPPTHPLALPEEVVLEALKLDSSPL